MNALLEASGLRFSYRDKVVLDVDRLEVMPGEILAILGANGAGKSTLFRMLLQLEKAAGGSVIARGRVAGVFQRPYLFEGTVADNLAYGLHGRQAARVQAVAEAFQLTALLQQRVQALSGGEAQRVALARALATEPDVLLLDEPTANLDAPLRRQFREDLLRAVRAHAGAVVLITHDAADAFGVADRIAVLEAGRIVQTGTPDELLAEPGTPFVAAFTGAELLLNGSIAAVAEGLVQVALQDGGTIWAAWTNHYSGSAQKGARVHVAYRPEDVVLGSIESSAELSARNQYRLRVVSLTGSGGLVRLRLEGQPNLAALITRTSCESLALRPGREVVAHLKATALRALPV